jgi:hypothetical protein
MDEFTFDASSMDALTRDLQESSRRFRGEADKALVEVGALISATAKKVAEGEGSSSIPPTIKVKPLPGMVAVTAGDTKVPLAALWDLGNRGKGKRKQKTFAHPVFATGPRDTWTWTDQPRHPILTRARTICRPAINELMNRAWDRALAPLKR